MNMLTPNSLTHDSFAGRRCLVTGGLGFIGSNVALALARSGAIFTVIDACIARHGANPANLVPDHGAEPDPRVATIEANLGAIDRDDVRRAALEGEFWLHLGGQVSHVDSWEDRVF